MVRRFAGACLLLTACAKGTIPGIYDLSRPVDAAGGDDLGGDGTADLSIAALDDLRMAALPDLSAGCAVVTVNEVQTGGAGGATDEFIELYNGCGSDVALDGWILEYEAAAGTMPIVLVSFVNTKIPAAKPYLVAGNKGFTGVADVSYSATSLAQAGGGIGLLDGNKMLVDSVGWGTATNALVEGSTAPAPAASSSIERFPDGNDGNDNGKDFQLTMNPTPGSANQ